MTTIEIIAKKAGVSRGTVDRVLHDRGQVKPETAERVRAVMEEMDFQPNALGRAFYLSRRKNKIGILVAFREPDFQQQIASGIEDGIVYARQHGIEIVTEIAPPDDDRGYLAALERLLSSDIQAFPPGKRLEAAYDILRSLPENHIPIVAYNQDVPKNLRSCFVGRTPTAAAPAPLISCGKSHRPEAESSSSAWIGCITPARTVSGGLRTGSAIAWRSPM